MQIEASFPVASDVPGPQKEKHDMFVKFCSAKKVFCKDCKICAHPASSTKYKHETRAAHNKLLVKLKKLSSDCMKLLPEIYEGHKTTAMDTNALTKDQVNL